MAPAPAYDSAVLPCLQDYLVFHQMHFPPGSPSSRPLWPSPPQSTADPALGLLSIPNLQLPAVMHSGDLHPCLGYVGLLQGFVSLIHIPFSPSQINCCTLQQSQMLLLCPNQLCQCQDLTSGPLLPECRSTSGHSPLFPLLPFILQVLLLNLSSPFSGLCLFSAGVLRVFCV